MVVMSCMLILCERTWSCVVFVGTYCSGFHILQCAFLRVATTWAFFLYRQAAIVSRLQYFFCLAAVKTFCFCPLKFVFYFLGIVVIRGAFTSWFSLAYVVTISLFLVHCFLKTPAIFFAFIALNFVLTYPFVVHGCCRVCGNIESVCLVRFAFYSTVE